MIANIRIVHLVESISSLAGGLQASVSQLVNANRKMGVDATVLSFRDEGVLRADQPPTDIVKSIHIGKYFLGSGLRSELIRINPNFVVIHGVWALPCAQVMFLCARLHIPYCVVTHGMLSPYILSRRSLIKKIAIFVYLKRLIRAAEFVRVLNVAEREHVISVLGIVPTEIIPNGVTPPTNINFSERKINTILHLCRIDPQKSTLELVTAWRLLEEKNRLPKDAILRIVGWSGDKSYSSRVEDVAKHSSTIQISGPLYDQEKWASYHEAGAYILPSVGEGLPTTVLEALVASCVPIFSSHCNFSPEVFGEWALRAEPDIDSIQSGILAYYALDNERKVKLLNAGAIYVKDFNWSTVGKKLLQRISHIYT